MLKRGNSDLCLAPNFLLYYCAETCVRSKSRKKISILPRAELLRVALVTERNLTPVIPELLYALKKPNIASLRKVIDFELRY